VIGEVRIRAKGERCITVDNVAHISIDSKSCDVTVSHEEGDFLTITVEKMSDVRLIPCRDWRAKPAYVIQVDKTPDGLGRLADD